MSACLSVRVIHFSLTGNLLLILQWFSTVDLLKFITLYNLVTFCLIPFFFLFKTLALFPVFVQNEIKSLVHSWSLSYCAASLELCKQHSSGVLFFNAVLSYVVFGHDVVFVCVTCVIYFVIFCFYVGRIGFYECEREKLQLWCVCVGMVQCFHMDVWVVACIHGPRWCFYCFLFSVVKRLWHSCVTVDFAVYLMIENLPVQQTENSCYLDKERQLKK